jgi:hypothetical protein
VLPFLAVLACLAQDREGIDFFEKKIRPVLAERCYGCHSARAAKVKGGLLLDTRGGLLKGGIGGPVLVPGDPDRSRLIRALRYADEEFRMPPKERLAPDQLSAFEEWVRRGAPSPDDAPPPPDQPDPRRHWAFRPPREGPVPAVKLGSWPRTTVDAFILARLEEHGLRPAPPADRRTLIRRATFDLIGLPPTPGEVEAFLHDPSPEAFERLVERLLASPHYGERWGRHWLDVARFSDTKGYVQIPEERRYVQSAAYRDWVIRALNEDLPYDQFLVQQIAADQMPSGGEPAALGFLTVGKRFKNMAHDIIDDRIDTVTRATMGLTVGCARCHDHKFDPIPIQDYYSLYGVFAEARERPVPLTDGGARTPARAAFEEELKKRQDALRNALDAARKRIEKRHRLKVAEYLAAVVDADRLPSEDTFLLLNESVLNPLVIRRWQAYIRQRGPADPLFAPWHAFAARSPLPDLRLNDRVARAFSGPAPGSMHEVARRYGELLAAAENAPAPRDPADEELRQALYAADSPVNVPSGSVLEAEYFLDWSMREDLLKLQGRIDRWILEAEEAAPHAVVLDEPPSKAGAQIFRRGNPLERGEEVPCRFLECVSKDRVPFREDRSRLDLALAVAGRENPLTARVMVNRLWLHHFGEGLVRTPSDFGLRSEPPTHPELLDWLARRFADGGFSIKEMHRLLMRSSVYRQSSDGHPEGARKDPGNRLLWRMNRRRQDFEELRDSLLAVSGDLDLSAGGRAVNLTTRPFSRRRSIYGLVDRLNLPSVFRVFDFPSPDAHSPRRVTTTTAPQALFLMNSPFVQEQAARLARRPDVLAEREPANRIRRLYALAYGRAPRPAEIEWGLDFVRSQPEPAPPDRTGTWQYGFGEFNAGERRLAEFRPLPYFTGNVWHAGPTNLLISLSFQQPDVQNGWPTLSAEGGHPGSECRLAVVRRWIAPAGGRVEIEGKPPASAAWIVSSRTGGLDPGQGAVEVRRGDTIDFIVDGATTRNEKGFAWAPKIRLTEPSGTVRRWDAARDFSGPPPVPLDGWGRYAQALLVANEFAFVD